MMLDFSDPADQLAWLVQQLQLSEEAGEVIGEDDGHNDGDTLE